MTRSGGAVAVFGATSYVGRFLLERLSDRGFTVYGVARSSITADILLRGLRQRVNVCSPEDLDDTPLDAVINLAYLRQSIPVGIVRRNRMLVDAVHRAALRARAPRLLHVSSAAVFGYRLREPPRPGPAPRVSGDSYFELKGDAERRLLHRARSAPYVPAIIRPGNILGPGSPAWVAGPAQRMLAGKPVALVGKDGFSNATYVRNLADYLAHAAASPVAELRDFGAYHHVAEFSGIRWSRWFEAFAETVGVAPVYAEALPAATGGGRLSSLAGWAARAYRGGPLGVWMRRLLGRLPSDELGGRMFLRLKTGLAAAAVRRGQPADAGDAHYLTIVSAEHEFRSHTLKTWTPPVDLPAALADMRRSLADDGFALGALPALQT